MDREFLQKESTGLWVIDVQEKLFPLIDHHCQVLDKICFAIQAASALELPLFVTEQYPQGLGSTVASIKNVLPHEQPIYSKTAFSGYKEPALQRAVDAIPVDTWILVGIEAHICVLQTAKDLIRGGKQVVVLNDAVSARSLFDFSTAISELRACGARISSTETVFYEIVRDANSTDFKAILPLVKQHVETHT